MNLIEVKEHKMKQRNEFIEHEADVNISGEISNNKDLVAATSIKVGFHPAKNGMYHFVVKKIEDGWFHIEWETYQQQMPFED